jgi:hypothetical protein
VLKLKSVAGPTSYALGGFPVRFGEFQKVLAASVSHSGGASMRSGDLVRIPVVSIAGTTVTIQIFQIGTGAASPAWAEAPAGTNFSDTVFTVVAEGE